MRHRSRAVRNLAGVLALLALSVLYTPPVQAQSPSGDIAECITDAWDEYIDCLDALPWWAELLCAARFTSDVILCVPRWVIGK